MIDKKLFKKKTDEVIREWNQRLGHDSGAIREIIKNRNYSLTDNQLMEIISRYNTKDN